MTTQQLINLQQKVEFEGRIFISFFIVIVITLASFLFFDGQPSNFIILGDWFGISPYWANFSGYMVIILITLVATLLRMWSGSILSSQRMMAFKIQHDQLVKKGPYLFTRNPIYLADFIAFVGFSFCLKPIGFLMPVLIYVHYIQLIIYEEKNLKLQFGANYDEYTKDIPRFFPNVRSPKYFWNALKDFNINYDGFRHNAQYVLLAFGFIISAFTGSLLYAILIGLPGIIDWAVIHTIKGVKPMEKDNSRIPEYKTNEGPDRDKVFEDLIYAQCWEDPEIDRNALKIHKEDTIFSITSGGCNVLTFLIDNPKKIIALDLNASQNYLLDLKMAAFRSLDYEQMLRFIGVEPDERRIETYHIIRNQISPESRKYWDNQPDKIKMGIIHSGRYEKYMQLLKKWLDRIMGADLLYELFQLTDCKSRLDFYEMKWNNYKWKLFTRVFLSRKLMTILFTKAFFEQLDTSFSFGDHFRGQIKKAFVDLPLQENYFLTYILKGNYQDKRYLPVYLREEYFDTIKRRLDRIEIVTASCDSYFAKLPDRSISKFNFSNIFEWIPVTAFEQLLKDTIRVAVNGAILTYRNLLVPRSRPSSLALEIEPKIELANQLHARDISFIYRKYVVEKINK